VTLHELFERQAARTPGSVALCAEGTPDLTYAELSARSDALAARLRESGVAPRTNVALLARTGALHVIAMLAVLKCGAAFATLDADAPAPRQQEIIDELTPSALVFDMALRDSAARLAGNGARVAMSDGDYGDPPGTRPEPVTVPSGDTASPEDVAFVAFTSGSTGRPKGIVQSHRSFAQFLDWFGRRFDFRPGTRLAQWAAPTYDAAYCEILGGLLSGAAVCMVPRRARNDPAAFLRWAQDSRITVLEIVPSYAAQLLRQLETANARMWDGLRYVLLAGEELAVPLASRLRKVLPDGADLYNLYGPSECVLASYHQVSTDDLAARSIPIGRAIDGRQLVLLDETGAECGPGDTGEICVRSEFLADGYLNDPARTARTFVDREPAGSRLRELRTGDLGRWAASGALEWLGRRDHMVKRRGVRIEIEDIQRRLRELPEVAECAVAVIHPGPADPAGILLVAYVVASVTTGEPGAGALHQFRRRATSVLPTQLIPDDFVLVPGLPKLPNGKVDRGALARIAVARPDSPAGDHGDLTDMERVVAGIYADVLGVGSVGADDDFFHLGGHSLLAMTVLDRIRVSTGADLEMLAIFGQPTVRQLAALVESRAPDRQATEAAAAADQRREFPLMPGQKALWVASLLSPANPAYNVPLVTAIQGRVDAEILGQALRGVIERHDLLRAAFSFDGENPVHSIAASVPVPLRVIDLTGHPDETKDRAAEQAVREVIDSPFDLETPGLIRAALVTLDTDSHILVLALHHLVCDEPSLHVLAGDLAGQYMSALRHEPEPAASQPQFEQFVLRYRTPAAGTGASEAREPAASVSQLRRATSQIPARRVRGVLSPRQAAAVRALAAQAGGTLFTTLLTSFGMALPTALQGGAAPVIDVPVSSRRADFGRCVGCFTEISHLSIAADRRATFRQLLSRTHGQLASAGASDGRSAPDAQALFTVHTDSTPFVQLAGLRCAPYALDRNTAKYRLGFYWRDDAATLSYIVEYSMDLYSRSDIDDLIARYADLIDQACASPDTRILS
jgi:amino acid adenylation domain-containing protein